MSLTSAAHCVWCPPTISAQPDTLPAAVGGRRAGDIGGKEEEEEGEREEEEEEREEGY